MTNQEWRPEASDREAGTLPSSEPWPKRPGAQHQERPSWGAVVVNYEAGGLLTTCVESLLADDSTGEPPEVVIVDNGSSDGSVAALRAVYPTVEVIQPGANLGYSTAANRGVEQTDAPIVAVCNPDLLVERGTAAAMLARFERESDLGAVGPLMKEVDGSRYPSARVVPSLTDTVGHALFGFVWPGNPCTRRYRQLDIDPGAARDVEWVSGAAIWLRRAALEAVGGWDEGYFMYVEDVDLCWRLREAGWRVAYEPSGVVTHVQGASTQRQPYRMVIAHHRSLLRFASKRWRGWRRILLAPAAAFLAGRALVMMIARIVRPSTPSGTPARDH